MNKIKIILREKGVRQTWLSAQLGKSYNMVNSYVQNRRQPSIKILLQIAEILDVGIADLLETNNKVIKNMNNQRDLDHLKNYRPSIEDLKMKPTSVSLPTPSLTEPSEQRKAEDWLKKQAIDPDKIVFCENGVTGVKLARLLQEYKAQGSVNCRDGRGCESRLFRMNINYNNY